MYRRINVLQMNRQHPGSVSFNELHPGWRSAAVATVCAAVLIFVACAALLPEHVVAGLNILG